ncbi:hypothetical protein [Tautonia sociabilis]|uniref:Uncharacterized protein n=1 Tax=Tautonia sociabilis TaxID=2080755 RepID=A0A432MD72_9BACT|nr:hypothetical protein [Tautonia sociabilis]RUL81693.1 hypothetical protein TsocGM_24755 [Tautonia sociabilis]
MPFGRSIEETSGDSSVSVPAAATFTIPSSSNPIMGLVHAMIDRLEISSTAVPLIKKAHIPVATMAIDPATPASSSHPVVPLPGPSNESQPRPNKSGSETA